MRDFHCFSWKEANFRIAAEQIDAARKEIIKQRELLGAYIERCPEFMSALEPLPLHENAPEIAGRMSDAAQKTGVGPMAAVAGAVAQFAVEAALAVTPGRTNAEEAEVIVENGGDIFLKATAPVTIALYAGKSPLGGRLALLIKPESTPLAVCSSSSTMGHSLSFGDCDLATVIAADGALADAAATMACNSVKRVEDIEPTLKHTMSIDGILGLLIIKDEQIGIAGELPELIKLRDPQISGKITHAPGVIVQ